jgi:hypothetical protein
MRRERAHRHALADQACRHVAVVKLPSEIGDQLHAAARRNDFEPIARDSVQRLHQMIAPITVDARHLSDMRRQMTALDELGQRILQRRGADLPAVPLRPLENLDISLGHQGVTQADIRKRRFRERTDIENSAPFIQALQGGDRSAVIMKPAIVIILDDSRADGSGEGNKLVTTIDRHQPSGRVLM